MKFGGLSEKEVSVISELLNLEAIPFSVEKDQELESFNSRSIQNDLRHYSPPNISTHVLAITIQDEDFQKISEKSKTKLLDFGITDQVPSLEDFTPETGKTIHQDMAKSQNRALAFNFKHQLIIGIIIIAAWYCLTQMS